MVLRRHCEGQALGMDAMGADIRVECYGGYRGEQEPRRFWLGERPIAVAEILDRWLSPEHRYFKVRADDDGTYILRHDTRADRWELTMFQSGPKLTY
jgi:hypothetical protein